MADLAKNVRFLGCLVSCVHECQVSEIFLDMSTKGKFHEQFWGLSTGYISEFFGGLCLKCEDSELFGDVSLGCEISKPFGVCVQDVRSQRHLGSLSQGVKSLNYVEDWYPDIRSLSSSMNQWVRPLSCLGIGLSIQRLWAIFRKSVSSTWHLWSGICIESVRSLSWFRAYVPECGIWELLGIMFRVWGLWAIWWSKKRLWGLWILSTFLPVCEFSWEIDGSVFPVVESLSIVRVCSQNFRCVGYKIQGLWSVW